MIVEPGRGFKTEVLISRNNPKPGKDIVSVMTLLPHMIF